MKRAINFTPILADGFNHGLQYQVKTDTLHIESWVEEELNPNRLDSEVDSLLDLSEDICRGSDGRLYTCMRIFCGEDHYGEYGIWAEVEERG